MYVTVRELDGPPTSYWMEHLLVVRTAILWRLLGRPQKISLLGDVAGWHA